MAKRSKSQTEITIQQIMDEAFKQILNIGYDAMSYTTLSEATGISRTGISHHFPKKVDFLVKLDERFSHLLIDTINFSSLSTLETSWMASLNRPQQKAILRLFFSLCGYNDNRLHEFKAVEHVESEAQKKFGAEGKSTLYRLIGQSAVQLLKEQI